MKRVTALTLTLAVLFPGVGLAQTARQQLRQQHAQTTLIAPDRQYQQWLDRMQVPTARGKVVVTLAPNRTPGRGEGGQSYPGQGQENIELQPNELAPARPTFLHELGHAFDRTMLNDQQRQRIAALEGQAGRKWYDGQANPPGEQFAELYRVLATKGKTLSSRAAYHRMAANESTGYMSHLPRYFQMRKIAALIDSL